MALPPKKILSKQVAPISAAPDPIPVVDVSDVDVSALDSAPGLAPAPKPKIPEVPISKVATTDSVQFILNKEISPCPVIGTFDFEREMSISKLVPGQYSLPRHVATHLMDKKFGQIISG